jgi:hypothetical protein
VPAAHLLLAGGHHQHQPRGTALQQVGEGLRGGRIAPVGVVEHDLQRRFTRRERQRRADAAEEPVAGSLGGHHFVGEGPLGERGVLAQLRDERRQLGPRRRRQPGPPGIVTGNRQLTDRSHPGLERNCRLRRAARQHDQRALGMGLCGGSSSVTGLADPRLTRHQHRPASWPGRGGFAQRRDLTLPADQRLLRIGGKHGRHPHAPAKTTSSRLGLIGKGRPRRQVPPAQPRCPYRAGNALELEVARSLERYPVARGDQSLHEILHQDLARSRAGGEAAGDDDSQPVQIVAVGDRLPRRNAYPRGDPDLTVRGVQALDRSLDLRRRTQGAHRAPEARHHAVAERLHHPPTASDDRLPHIAHMVAPDQLHLVVSKARQQCSRIDQIAEYDDRNAFHARHLVAPGDESVHFARRSSSIWSSRFRSPEPIRAEPVSVRGGPPRGCSRDVPAPIDEGERQC